MGKSGCLFVVVLMADYICTVSAIPDDECPDAYPARENCEFDEVCEDASCKYNQYVTCHLNRCGTCEAVFRGYDNLTVNCNQLTPKCRLLHLEMLHKSRTASSQPGGRRVDDLYDPECETNGTFKAKQCDDDSNLCWCVDSAGVRVTDKTGDDPKCDQLVRVHLIQIDFSFKVEFVFLKMKEEALRRKVAIKLVKEYTLKATQILEIKLKMNKFTLEVDGKSLQVERESVQVWFFDNEPPRINMKTISPGFAAIIIIIALAILTGIAVFVVVRRRAKEDRQRIQFEVIEGQEMEEHHIARRMGLAH
ncbi:epithelial cell adhesion molecule-like isoform X2 [Heterodontus francisci]|uniref:epithelial cell adhesion molecule-like isoform X2 n=1 Tax=Heterodontus francisci TaxID=7792 RepID=UPI00355B98AF